jgi:hypothetical protein
MACLSFPTFENIDSGELPLTEMHQAWRNRLERFTHLYNVNMPLNQAQTIGEWADRMRLAGPASEDDVTILLDGRRLDSEEKVLAWLHELEVERSSEVAVGDPTT